MGGLGKLFEKGPANAEKSLAGCLVANIGAFLVLALVYWLIQQMLG